MEQIQFLIDKNLDQHNVRIVPSFLPFSESLSYK